MQINPDFAEAHTNLGSTFKALGKPEEAIASYTKALQIKPDLTAAHYNLGIILSDLGKYAEAIASYTKVLQFQPDFAEAHGLIGNALVEVDKYEEAIASFTKALQFKPDYAEVKGKKIFQQARICDWVSLENEGSNQEAFLAAHGTTGTAVTPFSGLSLEDDPERHLKRSKCYAAQFFNLAVLPDFTRPQVKPSRLRIGYFSANFHDHPGMHLMARLFELHDRSEFQVHAYSFGPPSNSPMRARVEKSFDVFHDVRMLSDRQIAHLARDEEIDIAINRNGYTTNSRTGVFSHRAAPIQVSYLGYPGTMGAPFMDYIVADKTLIPEASQKFYSEKVVYLPHSYQVNDNTKRIADKSSSRRDEGLPETGFVFRCFNNTYKITPAEFDIWMRLLSKVDGSVLWLFESNPSAKKNLAQETRTRGIDPDRLVFAKRKPLPEHLARHRLADLFLDCNAHTTASDALWVGVPVLTKIGEGFAARVAGSLLNAIDLPELITTTEEAYENLALELATNPQKLQAIKEKLRANRDTKPLFDSALFTQHLEAAYRMVYDRYYIGEKPDHIVISDGAR